MRKLTTIKERLLHYIDSQGIKKEEFYQKIGIDGANFRGKNLKSEFSVDKIVKILRHYPEISIEWLLFGDGEMLKEKCNVVAPIKEENKNIDYKEKYLEVLEKNYELHERLEQLRAERVQKKKRVVQSVQDVNA